MPSAERIIVIDRPPGEVFAFFTDPGNDLKWRPHVKEVAAQGSAGVGATIHQVLIGPGGRDIPADMEVVAYEPPRRYALPGDHRPSPPSRRIPLHPVRQWNRGEILPERRTERDQEAHHVQAGAKING